MSNASSPQTQRPTVIHQPKQDAPGHRLRRTTLHLAILALSVALPVPGLAIRKGDVEDILQGVQKTGSPFFDPGRGSTVGAGAADERNLAENPGRLLDQARTELRTGRLDVASRLGTRLPDALPTEADAAAIASIALSAAGRNEEAAALAHRASGLPGDSVLVLCANAMAARARGDRALAIRVAEQATIRDPGHPYPWNILGRCHAEAGDTLKAQHCFARAVELEADFATGHANLGSLALASGDTVSAATHFTHALAIDPDSPVAHFGMAMVQEAAGQDQQAMDSLRRALLASPRWAEALSALARLELRNGLPREAMVTGKGIVDGGNRAGWLVVADALLQLGQVDHAIEALNGVPLELAARDYLLGYCRLVREDFEGALASMEAVLAREPGHPGAILTRQALQLKLGRGAEATGLDATANPSLAGLAAFAHGLVLADGGRWPEAAEALARSEGIVSGWSTRELDAGSVEASLANGAAGDFGLGVLLHLRSLPRTADRCFARVIAANPGSPLAHYWSGMNSLKGGDRAQALAHFETAAESAPRFFAALYAAAEMQFTAGQPARAAERYLQAFQVRRDPGLALRLGVYYENTGQPAEAEKFLREAVVLAPDFFAVHNQLAWHLAKDGRNLDEALALATRADALQPGNASVLDTIGWVLYQKRDLARAEQRLREATRANTSNPGIWYRLGVVLHAAGKAGEAREALSKALEISSEFESAPKARSLLDSLR